MSKIMHCNFIVPQKMTRDGFKRSLFDFVTPKICSNKPPKYCNNLLIKKGRIPFLGVVAFFGDGFPRSTPSSRGVMGKKAKKGKAAAEPEVEIDPDLKARGGFTGSHGSRFQLGG